MFNDSMSISEILNIYSVFLVPFCTILLINFLGFVFSVFRRWKNDTP